MNEPKVQIGSKQFWLVEDGDDNKIINNLKIRTCRGRDCLCWWTFPG